MRVDNRGSLTLNNLVDENNKPTNSCGEALDPKWYRSRRVNTKNPFKKILLSELVEENQNTFNYNEVLGSKWYE